jgi:heat shock protein HtpX
MPYRKCEPMNLKRNESTYTHSKIHLLFQTLVILAGMAGLFGVLGWILFGTAGMFWSLVIAMILFITTPRVSPWMVLRMYRARKLSPQEAPGLIDLVVRLSHRAGLSAEPQIYYVPSRVMNAFSVGSASMSAIALSDSLIRYLSWREMAGVLAHEITHIRNNDLRLHALADLMTRITSLFSFLGQLLIIFYLPLAIFSKTEIPLVPILILIFAPSVSMLLQFALSRTREFDADLGAAALTGDPMGLASALKKMDHFEQSIWNLVFLPGRRNPQPSMLRTHPHTNQRIERLTSLAQDDRAAAVEFESHDKLAQHIPRVDRPPTWNWFRPWY